jgi:hypothetical protein
LSTTDNAPAATDAARAEDFIQSIGVGTMISWADTPYGNTSVVENSIAYLGVDHVRDGAPLSWQLPVYENLAAAGVKFEMVVSNASDNFASDLQAIDQLAQASPGSVEAIEGPNEVNAWPQTFDGVSTSSDLGIADQIQQALYSAVHADPNLAGATVVNLSLGGPSADQIAAVGNMSGEADAGNWHIYIGSGNPPAAGLKQELANAESVTPGKPIYITETGYYTAVNATFWGGVNEDVQAKQTLDTLLDAYQDGAARTFLFQLLDTSYQPASDDRESSFGLFHGDGTPKEAATAVHNLTSILSDSASDSQSFTTGSLSYTLENLPSTGNSMLLEKSSGAYDLVVWNEPQIWDENTLSQISVAPTDVTVQLGSTYQTVEVFDPLQGNTPVQTLNDVSSVTLSLTDHPLIVEVEPQSGGSSSSDSAPTTSDPTQTTSGDPSSGSDTSSGSGASSGPDKLVLQMSEDAYQGDAQFTVSVDGKQVGGTYTTTALHADGQTQQFTITGDFGSGAHDVSVNFVNDAWDPQGPAYGDRNLYIDSMTYDGADVPNAAQEIYANSADVTVPAADSTSTQDTSSGSDTTSGPDKLVLQMSEDAYQGDAQFTVSVDGQQVGGTQTVTALHADGQTQQFTIAGNFGSGAHDVSVNFVNDAWDPQGPAYGDRNIYIDSMTYNGVDVPNAAQEIYANSADVTVPATDQGGTGTPAITMSDQTGQSYSIDPTQPGTVTDGDAQFVLTEGNNATVTLGTGTDNIQFQGMASINLTAGTGDATVQADAGQNTFTAGTGTLDVTGGSGADAYIFHQGDGTLKIEDFSFGKGDTLTVDQTLQGSMQVSSDNAGGTLLTFGSGSIDIAGVSSFDSSQIHFA